MPNSKRPRISDAAKRDLVRIGDYTRREWGAAQKRKYLDEIKEKLRALSNTPGIGAPRDDIDEGIRAFPALRHIIFYRETDKEVVIVRILHESMNTELHL